MEKVEVPKYPSVWDRNSPKVCLNRCPVGWQLFPLAVLQLRSIHARRGPAGKDSCADHRRSPWSGCQAMSLCRALRLFCSSKAPRKGGRRRELRRSVFPPHVLRGVLPGCELVGKCSLITKHRLLENTEPNPVIMALRTRFPPSTHGNPHPLVSTSSWAGVFAYVGMHDL